MRFSHVATAIILAFAFVITPAEPSHAKDGMAGFFSAMGKKDKEDISGKTFDTDDMHEMSVSGIKAGMTADDALKILKEKGFSGEMRTGGMNAQSKFENPIDKLLVNVYTYYDGREATDIVYKVFFQQTFNENIDIETWKSKAKKRYGEEPTREEENVMYYSDEPMLATGRYINSECSQYGGHQNAPACVNMERNPGVVLMVNFPWSNRMEITLTDERAHKEAMDAARKEKEDAARERSESAKENF